MTTIERIFASWQDSLNFLIGALLFFSPWLFGFGAEQTAALNAHVVGAIIAVMALLSIFAFKIWEEWISGVLGAWLVISPWVLGFNAVALPFATHVLIGIAVFVLAIWSASEHHTGHLAA